MKVFISWSGDRSKAVANALKEWLPDVLQVSSAWMSEHDIDAGSRWAFRLSQILEEAKIGIICLTPENQKSPWLLFEAGALSKSLQDSRLIPYLIGMTASDVAAPLSQFQSAPANKDGTQKLLDCINANCTSPLPNAQIQRLSEKWWPDLEVRIQHAISSEPAQAKVLPRSDRDIIEETLQLVRSLVKPEPVLPKWHNDDFINLEVDTRPLLGSDGTVAEFVIDPARSVSRFLDKIYFFLRQEDAVPAFSYGSRWLLKNHRTGEVYDKIGIDYCNLPHHPEDTTLVADLNLKFGDRLLVMPPMPTNHP